MVTDVQLPLTPVQLIGRTSSSNVPHHPTFHVKIPVSWSIVPGDPTEEPDPGDLSDSPFKRTVIVKVCWIVTGRKELCQ